MTNMGNPAGRTGAALDPATGLTAMETAAALEVASGVAPQTAARRVGYRDPIDAGKHLRRKQAFTDFVIAHMREKVVRYHQMLELSKQNLVYLLSSDETEDKVRAQVSLGVLRILAKTGRDGKSLIERALDEDKIEADPRTIAQRLIAATTAPALPGAPMVIDVEPIA